MVNLKAKDADNTNKFLKASGDGSEGSPYIVEHFDAAVLNKLIELLVELKLKPNLTETQSINGSVVVSNFPFTQLVNGTIQVSNFPVTQPINGTVEINNFPASQSIDGAVAITNFPTTSATSANQVLHNTKLDEIKTKLEDIRTYTDNLELLITSLNEYVDGLETLLSTANFTQSSIAGFVDQLEGFVDGIEPKFDTLNSKDFATQATLAALLVELQGKADLAETQPVSVSNFPATQPVSVSNFPATQAISGSVAVNNFPTTQAISGSVAVSNSSFTNTEFSGAFAENQSLSATPRDGQLLRNLARGFVYANQPGTIAMEQSIDASNWRPLPFTNGSYTISHAGGTQATPYEFKFYGRYYRMKYTNGATANTVMQMVTQLFSLSS